MADERERTGQEPEQEAEIVVTILDGQGNPYEATVLNSFMIGDKQYVAVLPVTPDEDGSYPIILFRLNVKDTGGEDVDLEIESIPENEYPAVAQFYEDNLMPGDAETFA